MKKNKRVHYNGPLGSSRLGDLVDLQDLVRIARPNGTSNFRCLTTLNFGACSEDCIENDGTIFYLNSKFSLFFAVSFLTSQTFQNLSKIYLQSGFGE